MLQARRRRKFGKLYVLLLQFVRSFSICTEKIDYFSGRDACFIADCMDGYVCVYLCAIVCGFWQEDEKCVHATMSRQPTYIHFRYTKVNQIQTVIGKDNDRWNLKFLC